MMLLIGIAASAQPSFQVQPQDTSGVAGNHITLRSLGSGQGQLTYQWRLNATPIPGANHVDLTVLLDGLAKGGNYDVVLTDNGISSTSRTARVTVIPAYRWVQQVAGSSTDTAEDVAIDSAGNVYTVGSFRNFLRTSSTLLNSAGGVDGFLVKHSPDGTPAWSVRAGGPRTDTLKAVAPGNNGRVHAAGTVVESSDVAGTSVVASLGGHAVLATFDQNGSLLWLRQIPSTIGSQGLAVATRQDGAVVFLVSFRGTALVGDSQFATPSGSWERLLVSYSPNGDLQWVRTLPAANALTIGLGDTIYVAGQFQGTNLFGLGLNSIDATDGFVAALDDSGNTLWATTIPATNRVTIHDIAASQDGRILAAGSTFNELLVQTTLTGPAISGSFVLSLASSNNISWVRYLESDQSAASLAALPDQKLLVGGYLKPGAHPIGSYLSEWTAEGFSNWTRRYTNNTEATIVAANRSGDVALAGNYFAAAIFDNHLLHKDGGDDVYVTRIGYTAQATAPNILRGVWTTTANAGIPDYGLTFIAGGSRPLVYQWTHNGTAIPGATNEILNLGTTGPEDAGIYQVTVSNAYGTATSSGTLSIRTDFELRTTPTDQIIPVGGNITWHTTASQGPGPFSYQWQKDESDILAATNQSLSLFNLAESDSGSYQVIVSNPYTNHISNPASLSVGTPVSITNHPEGGFLTNDTTAWPLAVTATGTTPINYQWFRNETAIPDATNLTYLVNGPQLRGSYHVVAANGFSSVTSSPAILILPPTLAWHSFTHGSSNRIAQFNSLDRFENSISAGSFRGNADFGGFSLATATNNSAVLISKRSADGTLLWARKFAESTHSLSIDSFAVSDSDRIHFAGSFASKTTMGGLETPAVGLRDMVVGTLDAAGNLSWFRTVGGVSATLSVKDLTTDSAGNVIIAGQLVGLADFGGLLIDGGIRGNGFVLSYDQDGAIRWLRLIRSSESTEACRVACDLSDNVYLVGKSSQSATLGRLHVGGMGNGWFLACLDNAGKPDWSTDIGRPVVDLAVGANGMAVVAVESTIVDPVELAAYDDTGNPLWSLSTDGQNRIQMTTVAIDHANHVYFGGRYQHPISVNGLAIDSPGTASGKSGIVFGKVAANGQLRWILGSQGAHDASPTSIATTGGGDVVVNGSWSGTGNLGGTTINNGTGPAQSISLRIRGSSQPELPEVVMPTINPHVPEKASIRLTPTVIGSEPMEFTWLKDGRPINDENRPSLLLPAFVSTNAGTYRLQARNREGLAVSQPITLGLDTSLGAHLWARQSTGDHAFGTAVDVDSHGNVLACGSFSAAIQLGPFQLSANGSSLPRDTYFARYSSTGTPLAASRFGGVNHDTPFVIKADGKGGAYVAGYFIAETQIGGTTFLAKGAADGYLVRIDADGSVLWAKAFGGPAVDFPRALALDSDGNLLLASWAGDGIDIEGQSFTGLGDDDVMVAKFTPTGDLLAAHLIGGAGPDRVYVAAPSNGPDVLFAGHISDNVDFGSLSIDARGDSELFLASLASDGTYSWVLNSTNSGFVRPGGIGTDQHGNIFVAGYFADSLSINGTTITNLGSYDIFLAKLSPAGTLLSLQKYGGPGDERCTGFAITPQGDSVIAGYLTTTAEFGDQVLTTVDKDDAFLLALDAAGDVRHVEQIGGTGIDRPGQIAFRNGIYYLTGRFEDAVNLDDHSITNGRGMFVSTFVVDPPPPAPRITAHPQSQEIRAGANLTLSAVAHDDQPLAYQWRRNGTPIHGANGPTFEIQNASASDVAEYDVLIANPITSALSLPARINIIGAAPDPSLAIVANTARPDSTNPILDPQGNPVDATYLGQLYVGRSGMFPIGNPLPMVAGQLTGGTISRRRLNQLSGGVPGYYQLRVWRAVDGPRYEVAVGQPGAVYGHSPLTTVIFGGVPVGSVTESPAPIANQHAGFQLTQKVIPAFVTEPQDVTAGVGQTVQLSATTTGSEPITISWINIDRPSRVLGRGNTFTISNIQSRQAGTYAASAISPYGIVYSRFANINVTSSPRFIRTPADLTVTEGASAEFRAGAVGTAPLHFQWLRNGAPLAGATDKTLSLSGVTSAMAGQFSVVVSNNWGSATSPAADLTILSSSNHTVTILSAGTSNGVSVKAWLNGMEFELTTSNILNNVTADSHLLLRAPNVHGTSRMVGWALDGTLISSNRTLLFKIENPTTLTAVFEKPLSPLIISPPISVRATPGETVTLTVNAVGSALNYEWFENGISLGSGAQSTLTVGPVSDSDPLVYRVRVSNVHGSIDSDPAAITTRDEPIILSQPESAFASPETAATFEVKAFGTGQLRYQWRHDDLELAGATNRNLTLPMVRPDDAGDYDVLVENDFGFVFSQTATLAVGGIGEVRFSTFNGDGSNPILDMDGQTPIGSDYLGQLYVGLTTDNLLPVGRPIPFLDGQGAGFVEGGIVIIRNIPGIHGGASGYYQILVWHREDGASYEEAAIKLNSRHAASPVTPLVFGGTPPDGGPRLTPSGVTSAVPTGVNQHGVFSIGSNPAPVVNAQPAPMNLTGGDSIGLSVNATGTGPLRYQWRLNGVFLEAATNSVLKIPLASRQNAGTYSVLVANDHGTTISTEATVRIRTPQRIYGIAPQSNGDIRLEFGDTDGTQMTPSSLESFEIQYSDSLSGGWFSVPVQPLIQNGRIIISDTPKSHRRYYRIVE